MSNVRSLNRVIIVGRVGREAENTTIASSGRELAKFPVVTNEGYFDPNSRAWKDLPPEWHNIVAWGPLAQKKIFKGDMVLVEGKIKTRKWKDQSGQERKTTEIEASNIVILDRKSKEGPREVPSTSLHRADRRFKNRILWRQPGRTDAPF